MRSVPIPVAEIVEEIQLRGVVVDQVELVVVVGGWLPLYARGTRQREAHGKGASVADASPATSPVAGGLGGRRRRGGHAAGRGGAGCLGLRGCGSAPLGQVLVHHPAGNPPPVGPWQTVRVCPGPHLRRGDRGQSGPAGWGGVLLLKQPIGGGRTGACLSRSGRLCCWPHSSAARLFRLSTGHSNGPVPSARPHCQDRHRCSSAPAHQRPNRGQHVLLLPSTYRC